MALIEGTAAHADAIMPLLSDADRDELNALTDGQGAAVMRWVVTISQRAWCGTLDDRPLFLAGALPDGVVWMLGTPEIARVRKFYLRATRTMASEMQTMFPVIRTHVDVRYVRSLRWLEWLGFDLGDPILVAGRMMCPAERKTL